MYLVEKYQLFCVRDTYSLLGGTYLKNKLRPAFRAVEATDVEKREDAKDAAGVALARALNPRRPIILNAMDDPLMYFLWISKPGE